LREREEGDAEGSAIGEFDAHIDVVVLRRLGQPGGEVKRKIHRFLFPKNTQLVAEDSIGWVLIVRSRLQQSVSPKPETSVPHRANTAAPPTRSPIDGC
jgi:hypothetical protein